MYSELRSGRVAERRTSKSIDKSSSILYVVFFTESKGRGNSMSQDLNPNSQSETEDAKDESIKIVDSQSEPLEKSQLKDLEDLKSKALNIDVQEDISSKWKLALSWNSLAGYLILFSLIFIVILPYLGSAWSSYSWSQRSELPDPPQVSISQNIPVEVNVDTKDSVLDEKINQRTLKALSEARAAAEDFASRDLDSWLNELKTRVDDDFLSWYYDYFNQKSREVLAVWRGVTGQNISEKEFQDFNRQFTSRVVSPEDIQSRLEVLTTEVTNLYALDLNKKLTAAQKDLKIPKQQWDLYLARISEKAAKRDPISGSALAGTSLAGGYVLADALLAGTVSTFFEGQAVRLLEPFIAGLGPEAASLLGVGAAGVVKFAGKFAGPVVGGGLIAYDLLTYSHKVEQEKPKLRERIFSDFQILKRSALADVTSRISQLESNIRKSIDSVSITELK